MAFGKVGKHAHLSIDRHSSQHATQHETGTRKRITAALGQRFFSQCTGRFYKLGVVQQHQRLQRCIGTWASRRAFLATGCIKYKHRRVQVLPLPVYVEAPPVEIAANIGLVAALGKVEVVPIPVGLIRLDARAADLPSQQAAGGKRRIAHHLGVYPIARLPREQTVFGIAFHVQCRHVARTLVGLTGDNRAQQTTHVPVAISQLAGQPFQKLRMARRFTLRAVIVEPPRQTLPKTKRPKSICQHPRHQRIFPTGHPCRQIEPRKLLSARRRSAGGRLLFCARYALHDRQKRWGGSGDNLT